MTDKKRYAEIMGEQNPELVAIKKLIDVLKNNFANSSTFVANLTSLALNYNSDHDTGGIKKMLEFSKQHKQPDGRFCPIFQKYAKQKIDTILKNKTIETAYFKNKEKMIASKEYNESLEPSDSFFSYDPILRLYPDTKKWKKIIKDIDDAIQPMEDYFQKLERDSQTENFKDDVNAAKKIYTDLQNMREQYKIRTKEIITELENLKKSSAIT
jgi:hypothetical protein